MKWIYLSVGCTDCSQPICVAEECLAFGCETINLSPKKPLTHHYQLEK